MREKNATKRKVPTMNQIKKFLKKEYNASADDLNSIDAENVIARCEEIAGKVYEADRDILRSPSPELLIDNLPTI